MALPTTRTVRQFQFIKNGEVIHDTGEMDFSTETIRQVVLPMVRRENGKGVTVQQRTIITKITQWESFE